MSDTMITQGVNATGVTPRIPGLKRPTLAGKVPVTAAGSQENDTLHTIRTRGCRGRCSL
jgi:hypothetical protein